MNLHDAFMQCVRELDPPLLDPIVADKVEQAFTDFVKYIPEQYRIHTSEDAPTVPLYDILTNPGEAILDLCGPFFNKQILAKGYFPKLRKQLLDNENDASGISQVDRILRRKQVIGADEYDAKPEELVRRYLRFTPFYHLLHTQVPFVPSKKALSEHCFICAKPGHGKTVLLSSFAAQFLKDPSQPGLFCLDPAGDWFEKLRDRVPPERLVVLDPETDPPPLNFFDFKNATEADTLQSFTYLMSSLSGGLSEKQGAIVPYLLKLLRSVSYASLETLRLVVDEKVKRPDQSQFWPAIQKLTVVDQGFFHTQWFHHSMEPTKQAVAWKLYSALSSEAFRKMFSSPTNSFDAHAAMRERKVVLARGSELTLGEHGLAVFLQYIVSQFFLASLARFRIPEKERHQCYLLCDEASHIFNNQIKRILVECRKLGLSFFGATQVIDQIPTEVKASIYGATSIKAAGNVSYSDAQQLGREMRCPADQIQNLKTFEWMFYVADMDRAVKVVVRPGMLEAMPKIEREAAGELTTPRNPAAVTGDQLPDQPEQKATPVQAPPKRQELSDIELVITTARRLETLLETHHSAIGRGLHEKLASAETKLPPQLLYSGRYIATMRNKVIHEDAFTLPDRERFILFAQQFEDHFSKTHDGPSEAGPKSAPAAPSDPDATSREVGDDVHIKPVKE